MGFYIPEIKHEQGNQHSLYDQLLEGLLEVDDQGLILYANQSFISMIECTEESDIIGNYLQDCIVTPDFDGFNAILTTFQDIYMTTVQFTSTSGKRISLKMSISESSNDTWLVHCLNQSPMQEVKATITKLSQKIDTYERQKDEFIWQLGHDLKTPLTPLTTLVPMVIKKVPDTDPQVHHLLKVIEENVESLHSQVDNILTFAQMSPFGTQLTFNNINVRSVIDTTLSQYKQQFDQKQVLVDNEVKQNLLVYGNKESLQTLFDQLFQYSLQSSKKESKITIFAAQESDKITVSYEDTGIGLFKHHLDHLFEEFYKTDDARHDVSHGGLNLAICKRIIDRHGGKLYAYSQGPGTGITFYFSLLPPQIH